MEMQPSNQCAQLLMGLPDTGKTTFLAALWHVVQSQSKEVSGSLRLVRLDGERDHLNKLCKNWRECRPIERTKVPAKKTVSMDLAAYEGGPITRIILPDLSGEIFKTQWETREWSEDFNTFASTVDGVLLLIHPDTVFEPVRIGPRVDSIAASLEDTEEDHADNGETEYSTPWTHDMAPTQTKLVDLIQFLMTAAFEGRRFRLAVVVSAWDLVIQGEPKFKNSPPEWLAYRLPMFEQFLRSNSLRCVFRTYGVSAQGGKLDDSKRLLNNRIPSERIIVFGEDCEAHDITAPIKWLMESPAK